VIDASQTIQRLLRAEPLREPLLREVIASLQLPPGSAGLDAGCGIGLQALLLAEAIGPQGHVTGVDVAPELLACGRDRAQASGYAGRVTMVEGDVAGLPCDNDQFDWAWSADCVGYPGGDAAPALRELVRVVRPGGRIVLLGWSAQQVLPGHALLEARLNATCSAYQPFLSGQAPERHFARAAPWLREAGLAAVRAQTFVGTVQSPLSAGERLALLDLFAMLWGQPQPGVSAQDWTAYQGLCLPESAECILNLPDYYAFFTYTLFQGEVVAPH
jgi:ubiquinone/menaquinone biosynthesis C-methylase UbiE